MASSSRQVPSFEARRARAGIRVIAPHRRPRGLCPNHLRRTTGPEWLEHRRAAREGSESWRRSLWAWRARGPTKRKPASAEENASDDSWRRVVSLIGTNDLDRIVLGDLATLRSERISIQAALRRHQNCRTSL